MRPLLPSMAGSKEKGGVKRSGRLDTSCPVENLSFETDSLHRINVLCKNRRRKISLS